jgi:hypothetical protein
MVSNVPICERGGSVGEPILAFAEGLELATNCRQPVPPITAGLHPKSDI